MSEGESLVPVEEFNSQFSILRVALTSEVKMEQEIDLRNGAVLAVKWTLKQSVVKRELSQKSKLSI